ncbi:MFS transporter [Aureibacter tunicatorum]|uniref:MFS family arabinose efflux permease n=1 Tax=Aureibacter tunicatorum TaxID=866807 RepID=A0AAE3XSD5_9BACT|nr:MFS transporter [Aureibacter tunicatorum]MDR6241021.1 putative MFS family arabinose efflux permease [Aureibacter tunicatorum]BDD03799.1 hypothetical protein AUTU_12820 [Aureibacter tunicatorum]
MKLTYLLVVMTLIAVVSDYMLHPFYPQFFQSRFGVEDPKYVGYYFASICFMVMLAFPLWAYVSKKIAELNILIYTQLIAGILAIACYFSTSFASFWVLALIMVMFKASYLLVYPFILKTSDENDHGKLIGMLSVVVHMGGICGAVLGGMVVDFLRPEHIFLVMASGDFLQMGVSAWLLKRKYGQSISVGESNNKPSESKDSAFLPAYIWRLGLVMFVVYFSEFLSRPFFSMFWESISNFDSKLISGFVYAVPGFVALATLWYEKKFNVNEKAYVKFIPAVIFGVSGFALQAAGIEAAVIIGRLMLGWAVFKMDVGLDVMLFEQSTPESYSVDYSKVHFFQNLGVLISSFSVGLMVDHFGLSVPFQVSLIGFAITFALYYLLLRKYANSVKGQNDLTMESANEKLLANEN